MNPAKRHYNKKHKLPRIGAPTVPNYTNYEGDRHQAESRYPEGYLAVKSHMTYT